MKNRPLMLAAVLASAAISQSQISVTNSYEEIAERGRVPQYLVQNGKEVFQVMPPGGWKVEVRGARNQLVFCDEKLDAALTITFSDLPAPKDGKEFARVIGQRFPGAKSIEESSCVARDASGLCLDVEFPAANGESYGGKVGAINYGTGSVEVALTGPVNNITKAHSAWTTVLNSLARK